MGAVDLNLTGNALAISGYYVTMIARKKFDNKYLSTWLKTPLAIKQYKLFATGSLIERQRVQFPTLSQIKTLIPIYEEQRQAVKTVSVDMNTAYVSFMHLIFPNALIIIDRFHIVQLLQTAFKDTRVRQTPKALPDHHSYQYKALKTHWRLFNKTESQLYTQHIKYYRGLNEFTTQQNIVFLGLEDQSTLAAVYTVYQTLLEASQNRHFKTFETTINQYQRTNTTMDTTIRTLKKKLPGI